MSGSATEELGKLFAEYKEKKVEPVIEEVTEEVVLSDGRLHISQTRAVPRYPFVRLGYGSPLSTDT